MVRIEPAADPGDGRSDGEGGDLKAAHVEAHEIGHTLVVVHGGDRDAEAGREQQPDQNRDCQRRTPLLSETG